MTAVPFDADSFIAKLREERTRTFAFGGRTFTVNPPELMSDETMAAVTRADDDDAVAQARLMIDDYDGFVEVGGSAIILVQILEAMNADSDDLPAGESAAS